MAILVQVVSFGEKPPIDRASLLTYLGFDINVAGKPVAGEIRRYAVRTEVADAYPMIIQFRDETLISDTLTVLFIGLPPESGPPVQHEEKIKLLLKELFKRIQLDPEKHPVEYFEYKNIMAMTIKGVADSITAELALSNRDTFTLVSKPDAD